MSAPYAAVEVDGEILVHATDPVGNYATLCGVSDDDDPENGRPAPLPARPSITCDTCRRIILHARLYRIRANKAEGGR